MSKLEDGIKWWEENGHIDHIQRFDEFWDGQREMLKAARAWKEMLDLTPSVGPMAAYAEVFRKYNETQ